MIAPMSQGNAVRADPGAGSASRGRRTAARKHTGCSGTRYRVTTDSADSRSDRAANLLARGAGCAARASRELWGVVRATSRSTRLFRHTCQLMGSIRATTHYLSAKIVPQSGTHDAPGRQEEVLHHRALVLEPLAACRSSVNSSSQPASSAEARIIESSIEKPYLSLTPKPRSSVS